MRKKATAILAASMICLTALWIIALAVIYISAADDAWGLLGFVILLPYAAILLIGILSVLGCIRGVLVQKEGSDRILSVFTAAAASVFGVLALVSMFVPLMIDNLDSPLADSVHLDSVCSKMFFAFSTLCVLSALIGGLLNLFIRKTGTAKRPRLPVILRTTAISLVSVIAVLVLFVPYPAGSYNDGGSRIYEAVFYDIVDWNRTQHFDGTPFHEDGQRMRIYFFPENCYDYDMRWNARH